MYQKNIYLPNDTQYHILERTEVGNFCFVLPCEAAVSYLSYPPLPNVAVSFQLLNLFVWTMRSSCLKEASSTSFSSSPVEIIRAASPRQDLSSLTLVNRVPRPPHTVVECSSSQPFL
jgi:hypothetical protein